jgi:DNA-binding CsgD family transcriptional regulator
MNRDMPASLPVNAAWLDASGVIIAVNENWKVFGAQNELGCHQFGVGQNYLSLCRDTLGPRHRLTTQLEALLAGRVALISWVYPCHAPDQKRWFHLLGTPRADGAIIAHTDISEIIGEGGWQAGPVVETTLAALTPTVLLREPNQDIHEEALLPNLTRRQAQVLLLIRQGKGNHEIAAEIGISHSVVKKHISALLRAFGFKRRYELVVPVTRSSCAAE